MKKLLIGFLLALTFVACKDDDENWTEDTAYVFLPRQCKFIDTEHMHLVRDGETPWGEPYYSYEVLPTGEGVEIQNYVLYSVNFNQIFEGIPNNYDFVNVPLHHLLPADASKDAHDMEMERQIEQFLKHASKTKSSSNSSSLDKTVLKHVEYRTNRIKKIDVYSTTDLFNRPKESSLIEFLKITSIYNGCIFDQEKQLINMLNKDMQLDQYNTYQPYASASMQLQFSSSPPEAPLETQFIVEMEMEGGTILRDTTDVVNLLP
jgi:hypothetical protein